MGRRKNDLEFKADFEPLYIELLNQAKACYKIFQRTPFKTVDTRFKEETYIRTLWDKLDNRNRKFWGRNPALEPYAVEIKVDKKIYKGILFVCLQTDLPLFNCDSIYDKSANISSKMNEVFLVEDTDLDVKVGTNIVLRNELNEKNEYTVTIGCILANRDFAKFWSEKVGKGDPKKKRMVCTQETFRFILNSLGYEKLFDDQSGKTIAEVKYSLKEESSKVENHHDLENGDVAYWCPLWCDIACNSQSLVSDEKEVWRRYVSKRFPLKEAELEKEYWFMCATYMPDSCWFDREQEQKLYRNAMRYLSVLEDSPSESLVDNFLLYEYRTRLFSCMFGIDNIHTLAAIRAMERKGQLSQKKNKQLKSNKYLNCLLFAFRRLIKDDTQSSDEANNTYDIYEKCEGQCIIPFDLNIRRNYDVIYLLTGYFAADKNQRAFWSDMLILLWVRPKLYEILKENKGILPNKEMYEIDLEEINIRLERIAGHRTTFEFDFKTRIDEWFNYAEVEIEVDETGILLGGMVNEFPKEGESVFSLMKKAHRSIGQNERLLYHTLRYMQWVFPDEKCLQTNLLKWGERTPVKKPKTITHWYDWYWTRWQTKN